MRAFGSGGSAADLAGLLLQDLTLGVGTAGNLSVWAGGVQLAFSPHTLLAIKPPVKVPSGPVTEVPVLKGVCHHLGQWGLRVATLQTPPTHTETTCLNHAPPDLRLPTVQSPLWA